MALFRERFCTTRIVVNQPLMLERCYDTEEDALKFAVDIPMSGVVRLMVHAEGFAEGDLESYVNVAVETDRFDSNVSKDSEGTPVGRYARQASQGIATPVTDKAATGEGGGPRIANQPLQDNDPKNADAVKAAEKGAKKDDADRKAGAKEVKTAGVEKASELNAEKEDSPSLRRKVLK